MHPIQSRLKQGDHYWQVEYVGEHADFIEKLFGSLAFETNYPKRMPELKVAKLIMAGGCRVYGDPAQKST